MYLEKPIEELMKLIEESGYSTYASWKIQHEMEEAKRLYDYLIEVQGVPDEETLKRGMSVVVVRYYLFLLNRLKYILPYDAMGCQFSVPLFLLEEFRDENILEKSKILVVYTPGWKVVSWNTKFRSSLQCILIHVESSFIWTY